MSDVNDGLARFLNKATRLIQLGSWERDLEQNRVFWSDITREILDIGPDFEPTSVPMLYFVKDGASRELISNAIEQAVDKGGAWDVELQIITATGKEKWVRCIGEAEHRNGTCVKLYGSFQDIDARKRAEIELQNNVKLFKDYMFALDESCIIAITDSKGVITSVNDNFCRISKYAREELLGRTHQVINSKYHPREFFQDLWQTISSGKTWRGEIKNRTKDGQYYWVYTTITPFLDSQGKPFQYLSIRFDITEKKLAEEALLNSLTEKTTILESIGDAFFAVDKNWIVNYWNKEAEKILQTPRDQIVGRVIWDIFSGNVDTTSYQKYHDALAHNEVVNFEDYYAPLDKWFEISAYPSENGLSVYFKDISPRKISEIHLKELNESLMKQARELAFSNAELEQFAYVASHDLQEPLRMVTSFLTQLERKYKDELNDQAKTYINFAVDGARRMRQTILDLLEYSRVGRKETEREDVDLNELISEIRILFQKKIETKRATLEVDRLPVIKGSKAPFRQIFQNLISNALKYSGIERPSLVRVRVEETNTHWQFSISDNGIGIAREYFERIFIIFQRLHTKNEYAGTGMGLTITKKIVENYGGKIWLESEEGTGSTFYFTIEKNPV